jgi:hypothetical protein
MDETRSHQVHPGDPASNPGFESNSYSHTPAISPLGQANSLQSDLYEHSASSTYQRPNLSKHHNTSAEPLLPHIHTTTSSSLVTASHNDVPVEKLVYRDKPPKTLFSSPKPIGTPIYIKILNRVFDFLLLAGSTAFLAFALIVSIHDQDSTTENPRLTRGLLNATQYV